MRRSKPYMRSLFHRSLTRREHAAPKPIQAIEQKEPRRAHKGLRLGYANLGTVVVAEHLCRPLSVFAPAISLNVSIAVREIPSVMTPRPGMTRENGGMR